MFLLEMAIFTLPMSTRPDLTLMGWVLPGSWNIRGGLGFNNPTCIEFGSSAGLRHTHLEANPNTIKLQKYPNYIYIYITNFQTLINLILNS